MVFAVFVMRTAKIAFIEQSLVTTVWDLRQHFEELHKWARLRVENG